MGIILNEFTPTVQILGTDTISSTDDKLRTIVSEASTYLSTETQNAVTQLESAVTTKITELASVGDKTYTSAAIDTKLGTKADKATTLGGYGITDANTKTEVSNAISLAVDNLSTNMANALASKADSSTVTTMIANVKVTQLSGITAYHLYNGSLTLSTTAIMAGFGIFLYTGNTTTLPTINLGMDIESQWGNDASEKYGYHIEIKSRSASGDWVICNSIRGNTKYISSNATTAEQTDANLFTLSTTAGVTTLNIGTSSKVNTAGVTYVVTVQQTTHRRTGTTNHGQAFTEHYNPYMGFTIESYVGSSNTGHEIPHSLGREFGFATVKNLSAVAGHIASYREAYALTMNLTDAEVASTTFGSFSDTYTSLSSGGLGTNTSTNQYIMYGWANSYYDAQNNLIGNYEISVYPGSGVSGNKVTTRSKPALVMIKGLDSAEDWVINDNLRGDKYLYANTSSSEGTADVIDILSDGFALKITGTGGNRSGGQYLYMVVYDNDSGSGKSKYPKALDNPTANLNALVPFAQGIDVNGTKNTILSKNETIAGVTYTQGKNYLYLKVDGTYGVSKYDWGTQGKGYNGFGDFLNQHTNKWYAGISVFADDFSTITNWTADENSGGTAGSISAINGELKIVNAGATNGAARTTITTVAGKKYALKVKSVSSGGTHYGNVFAGTTARGYDLLSATMASAGEYTYSFTANSTTTYIQLSNQATSNSIGTFDYIAIYPINNDGTPDLSGAVEITSRNYLDAIIYADQNGQIEYIEQLPKTTCFDKVCADTFQGNNVFSEIVFFDGTTTPPTIIYNKGIKAVIRVGAGVYDIYFNERKRKLNYGCFVSNLDMNAADSSSVKKYALDKVTVITVNQSTRATQNNSYISVGILGGD